MNGEAESDNKDLVTFTVEIVSAYVRHNSISAHDLPPLISTVHAALKTVGASPPVEVTALQAPAVPIRKSVTPDFIICLEDGTKFKSLKRHLMTHLQMTPEDYRTKWNLPSDYPMVAPAYAAIRSTLAKSNGLGRKPAVVEAPVKRRRASGTASLQAILSGSRSTIFNALAHEPTSTLTTTGTVCGPLVGGNLDMITTAATRAASNWRRSRLS